MEQTFVMLKPDAVLAGLVEPILRTIKQKGFIVKNYDIKATAEAPFEEHYKEHLGKPFYPDLLEFMRSSPHIYIMVVEGPQAIAQLRLLAGATDPLKRDMGSIRGKWSNHPMRNLIHTSDSEQSAEREIELWFGETRVLQ